MRAGPLDRRIELQSRTTAKDSYGEEVISFTSLAFVWASKRDERGREFLASNAERAEAMTIWAIRWRSDVKAQDRLVYATVQYDIESISELGRRDGLELICKRVQQ